MRRLYTLPITLSIGLAFLLHAPSFFRPFMDLDEGSYAAIACRLLQGGLPYRNGVENKFPLIFYTYKGIFALFGRYNMVAVHLVCTVVVIATALSCGAIARRFGGRAAAFWTATLYVVFSASYYPKMLAGNTEMFAVLPSALAVWCYLEARDGRPLYFALAGALGGVTLLFKQVAAATFAALCADRALDALRRRTFWRALGDLGLLTFGLALVLVAMVAHLRSIGVWDDAVFWTWTYVFRHYIPSGTRDHGFAFNLLTSLLPFSLTVSPLWLLAWRVRRGELLPIWWWLAGSLGASLVGGRMYGHYFLLMVPALAVLAGVGAADWLRDNQHGRRMLIGALAFVGGASFIGACLFEGSNGSFWSPKPDYRLAGAYVRARTQPDERVFVWGWFPALYHAADRCPSTRFIYTHVLSGAASDGAEARGHNVPEGWAWLMADLEADPPAYLFDTSVGDYSYPFPIQGYPALWQFVSTRYTVDAELGGVRIYRRADRAVATPGG